MRKIIGIILCLMLLSFVFIGNIGAATFNYGEALQKAILFYEAQRSGKLSTASIPTRLTWRGDAQVTDGQDVGLDLTGGWVDAGDNMKYNITSAGAAAFLAWSVIEYRQAYENSGQLNWLMNQLRWINDFFIKCHPEANVFYGQIGMTASDHNLWIPIESTQYYTDRKAIKLDTANPGTDLVLQVAAAMAASSIVFRPTDPDYADILLSHAEQLFTFPVRTATPVITGTPTPVPTSGSIKVQFYNQNTAATSNQIYLNIKLVNTGISAVTLSGVKIRYYYTIDGVKPQNFYCDYSPVGSSNVTGTFVTMATPKTGADTYVEIGFLSNAGSLAAGANTVIQARIAKNDWTNYIQSDDYSFNTSATTYVDWTKVTGYVSGSLQWGIEP